MPAIPLIWGAVGSVKYLNKYTVYFPFLTIQAYVEEGSELSLSNNLCVQGNCAPGCSSGVCVEAWLGELVRSAFHSDSSGHLRSGNFW